MTAREPSPFIRSRTPGRPDSRNSKSQSADDFVLENVCGALSTSKSVLAANPANEGIAFAASSVLVFMDPRYCHQDFLENPSGRNIQVVAFSKDGKYVAFGEVGYNPKVYIYTSADHKLHSNFQVMGLCTVKDIVFHPKSIYLAILCASTFNILLFNTKGRKLVSATCGVEPLGMTLPEVGSYLVVCGHRKLSVFSFADVESNRYATNIVFDRRSVLLGHQTNYTFVDVDSGTGLHNRKIYAVTSCGYLCNIKVGDILINNAHMIDDRCFCVKYCFGCVFVGCARNTVKICDPVNLSTLKDISNREVFAPSRSHPNIWKVEADTIALAVNSTTRTVTVVYSDHRRHSWRVFPMKDSITVEAIIPVDGDGKKVTWQPTSYEIQSHVANVLNRVPVKCKAEGGDRGEKLKAGNHSVRHQFQQSMAQFYVNATRFTPDGKYVICGNAEGEIKIFDALTGRLHRVIEAHNAPVTHIELLFDEHYRLLASGGRDRVIFILDVKNDYSLVQVLCQHSSAIVSISMAHNGETLTLVSSSTDGVILIRRAIKGKQLRFVIVGELSQNGGKPRMYVYAHDYIITGGDKGKINVFHTDPCVSTKPAKTMKSSTKGTRFMTAVVMDPSGSYLVANSDIGALVFNTHTGKHIATLNKMMGVSLFSFTTDCKRLISESNDGCQFIWRLPQRMTEVITSRMSAVTKGVENAIPFERILSSISLTQEQGDGQKLTSVATAGPMPVATSKISYRNREKMVPGKQEVSVNDCESFTSCSTCSRSYTDVFNYSSRAKTSFSLSRKDERVQGLSEEAKRLLCNKDEQTATWPTEQTSVTTSKDKPPPCSQRYLAVVEKAREGGRMDTDPTASALRRISVKNGVNEDNDTQPLQRKSFLFWNSLNSPTRNVDRHKKSLDKPLSSEQKRQHEVHSSLNKGNVQNLLSNSPVSEYYSADSHDSIHRGDHSFGKVGLVESGDSKTIQQSEMVSEMYDYVPTQQNTQPMSLDESVEGICDTDQDGLLAKIKMPADLCTSNRTLNLWERASQAASINLTIGSVVKKEMPRISGVESDHTTSSTVSAMALTDGDTSDIEAGEHLNDPESVDALHQSGSDVVIEKESVSEFEDACQYIEESVPGIEGKSKNDDKQDTNQNTGVFTETKVHNPSRLAMHSHSPHSGSDSVDNSSNLCCAFCDDRLNKRSLLEMQSFVDSSSPAVSRPGYSQRNLQLSNSQETYFNIASKLKAVDLTDDLSNISIADIPTHDLYICMTQDNSTEDVVQDDSNETGLDDDQEKLKHRVNGYDDERDEEFAADAIKAAEIRDTVDESTAQVYQPDRDEFTDFGISEETCVSMTSNTEAKSKNTTAVSWGIQRTEKQGLELASHDSRNNNQIGKTCTPSTQGLSHSPLAQDCASRQQTCNATSSKATGRKQFVTAGHNDEPNNRSEQEVSQEINIYPDIQALNPSNSWENKVGLEFESKYSLKSGTMETSDIEDWTFEEAVITNSNGQEEPSPSSEDQGSKPANRVIIQGLGSVGDLFRNKDEYIRRLKEVRRNFEMGIQALKEDRIKQPCGEKKE